MSEPRRKLSISVPELPWERKQKDPDLSTWEEARFAAMKKAAKQKARWAGTD